MSACLPIYYPYYINIIIYWNRFWNQNYILQVKIRKLSCRGYLHLEIYVSNCVARDNQSPSYLVIEKSNPKLGQQSWAFSIVIDCTQVDPNFFMLGRHESSSFCPVKIIMFSTFFDLYGQGFYKLMSEINFFWVEIIAFMPIN